MEEKMLGAVFEGEGKLILKEVPVPKIINGDEVILEVKAISICGTDVHILKVPPGIAAEPNIILGHEMAGIVKKIGTDVKNIKVGDYVAINPCDYCNSCKFCKMDLRNLCDNQIALGVTADGGFAKYCKTTEKVCHKISPEISPEIASLTEILADVLNGVQKVNLKPWEVVVVLGGGPIGNLYMQVFKRMGAAKVILSDISEYRSKIAKECGADIIVNPRKEKLEEVVKKETGIGADIVVDVVGSLLDDAINIVRKGGKILLFGTNTKYVNNIKQADITINQINVIGTFIGNCYFPQAVSMIESGVLNLEKIVTHKFPLIKIKEALELVEKGKALKVVVMP